MDMGIIELISLIVGIIVGICITIAYFKGAVSWILRLLGINKTDTTKDKRIKHDSSIIAGIMSELPYEKFRYYCEIAHFHGMEEEFSNSLAKVNRYKETPYKLYARKCETKKQELLLALEEFHLSLSLAVIYDGKAGRYVLPYELKGTEDEYIYRKYQHDIHEKAHIAIKKYDEFILAVKKDDLYDVTI